MSFRAPWRIVAVIAAAALVLGACASKDEPAGGSGSESAPDRVTMQAGVNDSEDPTIAVMAFLPPQAKVKTGATVVWTIPGPEPHSVTFVPEGEQLPSPEKAAAEGWFEAKKVEGDFDGTVVANSGVGPLGPTGPITFELKFAKAGTYDYVCVIHPRMTGKIDVVDSGAETQAAIDARAKATIDEALAEGRAAKKKLVDAGVKKSANPDGSTNWTVEMGTATRLAEILAFAPTPAEIKAGDTVTFVNNSAVPHTASFGGDKVPQNPESPEAMKPAPGGSPQTLAAEGYFNTGWLPPAAPPDSPPPLPARSFTFKVPTAGEYAYVCILHVPSAMVGVIKVA